eukprot:7118097-Karenia_brevis.AAC.1
MDHPAVPPPAMANPAASRSTSRSPKGRTPNQPGTSSSDPQGSSHVPIHRIVMIAAGMAMLPWSTHSF